MALWNRCSICGRDIPVGEICYGVKENGESICADCIELENEPSTGVVSKTAFEQVVWERDTALRQLREDYGVGLGEKKRDVAEVRYGRWIVHFDHFAPYQKCSVCGFEIPLVATENEGGMRLYKHCPECTARMDKEDEYEIG